MTRQEALDIVRQAREGLAKLYGDRLKAVYLFGSYARGDADEDSDIDVAVVLTGPVERWEERDRCNQLLTDLSLEHDCLLSAVHVSQEELLTGTYAIHRSIIREGVPV